MSMKSLPKRSIWLAEGFRQILLVAGEHPKFVSQRLSHGMRACACSVFFFDLYRGRPDGAEDYVPVVDAGAEGLVVYQETYNRGVYGEMHTARAETRF